MAIPIIIEPEREKTFIQRGLGYTPAARDKTAVALPKFPVYRQSFYDLDFDRDVDALNRNREIGGFAGRIQAV